MRGAEGSSDIVAAARLLRVTPDQLVRLRLTHSTRESRAAGLKCLNRPPRLVGFKAPVELRYEPDPVFGGDQTRGFVYRRRGTRLGFLPLDASGPTVYVACRRIEDRQEGLAAATTLMKIVCMRRKQASDSPQSIREPLRVVRFDLNGVVCGEERLPSPWTDEDEANDQLLVQLQEGSEDSESLTISHGREVMLGLPVNQKAAHLVRVKEQVEDRRWARSFNGSFVPEHELDLRHETIGPAKSWLFGYGVLTVAAVLAWFAFDSIGSNYLVWYISNGALIAAVLAVLAYMVPIGEIRQFLSLNPTRYVIAFVLLGSLVAYVGDSIFQPRGRVRRLVWKFLTVVSVVGLLVVLGPLQYLAYAVAGAPARKALSGRSTPAYALRTHETGSGSVTMHIGHSNGTQASEVHQFGVSSEPFAFTNAVTAVLLLLVEAGYRLATGDNGASA